MCTTNSFIPVYVSLNIVPLYLLLSRGRIRFLPFESGLATWLTFTDSHAGTDALEIVGLDLKTPCAFAFTLSEHCSGVLQLKQTKKQTLSKLRKDDRPHETQMRCSSQGPQALQQQPTSTSPQIWVWSHPGIFCAGWVPTWQQLWVKNYSFEPDPNC